jgi:hypothetical protein
MAKTVAILGRSYLPGPGFNTSGTPKQGKTQTWGVVTISSYTASGEPLTPNDLGLTAIDFVQFNVDKIDGADLGHAEGSAVYQYTNQKVSVFEAAADQADTSAVLRFMATGDSARDVESLS